MVERVLLVTADDGLARAAGALAAAGAELLRERDGAAGLAAAARARPDVVVWDGELPDETEGAIIARLRAAGAAVVVIGTGDMAGGVRALRDGAEQLVARPVDPEHLSAAVARAADTGRWRRVASAEAPYRPRSLADVEREQIERALRHHNGNRTRAARDLGISRATLINKIRVYALDL